VTTRNGLVGAGCIAGRHVDSLAARSGATPDVRTPYREALHTHRLATAVATAVADRGTVQL
jgi:hypothetical protein